MGRAYYCQLIPQIVCSIYVVYIPERKDDEYERILFFSDYPSDYVFLMSCIDLKTSPYACRDRFYLTLESSRDPPNHFKWLEAAQELKAKMNLTFDDPRFMFNFVMTRKYMHVTIILLLKKKQG